MSQAWEVTLDDIEVIIAMHDVAITPEQIKRLYDDLDHDAVEQAVLRYVDFDDQERAASSDIEDQLIANGIIENDKCFVNFN